jgi:hypothetical protein
MSQVASKGPKTPRMTTKTPERDLAASLLAEASLTDQEIAERVGIDRQKLRDWKRHPQFQARVQALQRRLGNLFDQVPLGRKLRRVQALQDRWDRLNRIIAARSTAVCLNPDGTPVPGAETGLLAPTLVGRGKDRMVVYKLDVDLLRELREIESAAAKEMGQIVAHSELTILTPDLDLSKLSDADLALYRELRQKARVSQEEPVQIQATVTDARTTSQDASSCPPEAPKQPESHPSSPVSPEPS